MPLTPGMSTALSILPPAESGQKLGQLSARLLSTYVSSIMVYMCSALTRVLGCIQQYLLVAASDPSPGHALQVRWLSCATSCCCCCILTLL